MKKITKSRFSISIDKNLNDTLNHDITNKSKYIEWLIFQDLKEKNIEKINNIII